MNVTESGSVTNVREKYRVDHNEIGHGHYGVVRKCQNRYEDRGDMCIAVDKSMICILHPFGSFFTHYLSILIPVPFIHIYICYIHICIGRLVSSSLSRLSGRPR